MPTFETQKDQDNENAIVLEFLNTREDKYEYTKLPKWELDFMITDVNDEKIVCFLEIKCFTIPFDTIKKQMIAYQKYEKMKKYNAIAPTYFLAKYGCGTLAIIHVSSISGKVGWGGRAPRGGANDLEKIIWCPKEKLKIIS